MSSPKGYLRMISFLGYVYVTTLILSYVPVLHRSKRARQEGRGGREKERDCEKEMPTYFSPLSGSACLNLTFLKSNCIHT